MLFLCLLLSSLPLFLSDPADSSSRATYTWTLDIPPRVQWSANCAYSGETSFVQAGLFFGQYMSQYDARLLSCNKTTCTQQCVDKTLVGVNDLTAAKGTRLDRDLWKQKSTQTSKDFLEWVRSHVSSGFPVIIGVFKNYNLFTGSTDPNAGSSKYDHIVTVTGWQSKYPATDKTFHEDDIITIEDHGLYHPSGTPQYSYSYSVGSFLATRAQANAANGPVYSLNNLVGSGIALNQPEDTTHEILPVRVYTNLNYEKPEIVDGSNTRPDGEELTLTVKVSNVVPGKQYNLYRYSSFHSTPKMNYNQKAHLAASTTHFSISTGSTFTLVTTIQSYEMAIFRAVLASSP